MSAPVDIAAITGAEMRTTREYLGLSTAWLSRVLGVSERKLMRWEADELPIPPGVAGEMDDLYEEAAAEVARWSKTCRVTVEATGGDVELHTYHTDDDYWRATNQPGVGQDRFPARWHRMICARVAENVPGVVVTYARRAS